MKRLCHNPALLLVDGCVMNWTEILNSALEGAEPQGAGGLRSPANEWLDFPKLTSWSEGRISSRYVIEEKVLNSRGFVFGGYYSFLADALLGLMTGTVLNEDQHFTTTDLRLQFFRPVNQGEIRIEGEVVNRSKRFVHGELSFYDASDKLLVKAFGIQTLLSKQDDGSYR